MHIFSDEDEKGVKGKVCFKSGEPNWTQNHNPAMTTKSGVCNKIEHFTRDDACQSIVRRTWEVQVWMSLQWKPTLQLNDENGGILVYLNVSDLPKPVPMTFRDIA